MCCVWVLSRSVMSNSLQSLASPSDPKDCSPPHSSVHGDSPGKNIGMGCHALLQRIFPTQESNPGVLHCRWILYSLSHQGSTRILEWVAYPFSRETSQPRNQTATWETWVRSLGWEDPLEEGMATHSNILAWRIPMDRGAWRGTVHGVSNSRIRLSD